MANEYATVGEVKSALQVQGESFADPQIGPCLTAASRGLDDMLDRRFWSDTDDTSVRLYTGTGECELEVDDLIDLAALKTDDDGDGVYETTWTQGADFVLLPLNAAADGEPWTSIETAGAKGFPTRRGAVQVTGQFGWVDVPANVKVATIMLTSRLLMRLREAPLGIVTSMDNVVHIARTDPDIKFLVGSYDKTTIAIA